MLKNKKQDSNSFIGSAFLVNVLLICASFLNFQPIVNASCVFTNGQIGECVKFEECRSAVILSRKGVNPGFCDLERGTVCCTDYRNNAQVERRPYSETQSNRPQKRPSQESFNLNDTPDVNTQKKKHGGGGNNNGKKKNSDIIEEPYSFEPSNTFYSDSDFTNKPVRQPSRPKQDQDDDGYFVPPGLAKKKWREEKTTENDYIYEIATKKPSRGPSRKNSNKHTGNSNESNNSRRRGDSNTTRRPEWSSLGGRRTTTVWYDDQNEYENDYSYQRTTPKNNKWGQETYTTTKRPGSYGESGNIFGVDEEDYSNVVPTRRPQRPSSSHSNTNRPNYQSSSNQGNKRPTNQGNRPNYQQGTDFSNNRPNYQQGSEFSNNRPNYQQGSEFSNNRPNYHQGSEFSNNRPNYQQGSEFSNNRPNYQQGSNNRPNSRPGFQKKSISEQKCEEYSKQVTENITGLPLTTNPDPVTIPVRKCITPQQLIVGGENTTIGEFPHMAAVGFRDVNNKKISWKCGGTLISDQYVMTAAHCTSTAFGRPVKVRLGEYNLMKNDDGAYPVDYGIVDIITHPNYKPPAKYNDIALLKLSRKVTFFKHIRPACLYSEETFSASKAIATGWGRVRYEGTSSEILQKVVLSIVDNVTCNRLYKVNIKTESLSRGIIDSQMCAGELSGGKDTCQGDSGGPLSITSTKCIHHIIGVTSFGKSCALPNSTGVYTRVSAFVPWIESIVWPESY